MSFAGFSEEDLKKIQSGTDNDTTPKKSKPLYPAVKKKIHQYKSVGPQNHKIDDAIDDLQFNKCRLSIKSTNEIKPENVQEENNVKFQLSTSVETNNSLKNDKTNQNDQQITENCSQENGVTRRASGEISLQYSADGLQAHTAKLEELQLKQRLMEEQNKKRKEMLARALADRTRQTEEEVLRLEKIKKELQVLDGQFSQDVGVLRKKIDLACLTYSEAEKHYLKVEKEFLQAKIQLQKEKEKKELLTEHLCALITHNETRKAQKLETLMLELATNKANTESTKVNTESTKVNTESTMANTELTKCNIESIKAHMDTDLTDNHDNMPIIIDGVDQRTGKIVEFNGNS